MYPHKEIKICLNKKHILFLQLTSSDPSAQSLRPLHCLLPRIQFPSSHLNWSGPQVCTAAKDTHRNLCYTCQYCWYKLAFDEIFKSTILIPNAWFKSFLFLASQMRGFAAFSLLYVIVNRMRLVFGLLFKQSKNRRQHRGQIWDDTVLITAWINLEKIRRVYRTYLINTMFLHVLSEIYCM